MKRLFCTLMVIFISISFLQAQHDQNELLDCWIQAFGKNFDFYAELDKLEREIVALKIVPPNNSGNDYINLLNEVRADLKPDVLDKIDITRYKYISETSFRSCIDPVNILKLKGTPLKYGMLLSVYVIVARHQHATVHHEVAENHKLKMEGEEIVFEDFDSELDKAIKKLLDSGVIREEIWLSMHVHPETKMGIIVDIQTALRNKGIRKINYSPYD
ncbi:MAG: hypothetical protein HEP71_10985 [Roseivirga sp.]|nr:hypothetical protein [Roseivirga sp.]